MTTMTAVLNRNSASYKRSRKTRLATAIANDEPCCRCGGPIDWTLSGNHPAGPTLDHLDAVLHTGTEDATQDRLAFSHNRCNKRHGGSIGHREPRNIAAMKVKAARPIFSDRRSSGPLPTGSLSLVVSGVPGWWPQPPDGQSLPAYLTAPHPDAAGSYGREMLEWAGQRPGMHPKRTTGFRWWQQLVATAALQHDAAGELLMGTVVLGTDRQVGKSWLLRALALWRLEQAQRWGEVQTIVHTAAKLSQAEGVWRPAAFWAARAGGYEVRRSNGSAMIGRGDGSAWIPQAATDQVGVSLSVSVGIVDEAWDVPRWVVDNGLVPTLAESANPQLWIVSTAGRPKSGEASDLYSVFRGYGLEQLAAPRDVLLVEWSAAPDADPGDPATWRAASPFWDERRADLFDREWSKASKSEAALESFRMQWLNQWPDRRVGAGWLPADSWWAAQVPGLTPGGWVVAAVEDRVGGGGFAAVSWLGDGDRVATVAAGFDSVGSAWAWADQWAPVSWLCGMSLRESGDARDRAAEPRGSANTSGALVTFRELVTAGGLSWDSEVLAANVLGLRVTDSDQRSGLSVVPTAGIDSGPVRCAAWAVHAVQRQIGAALSA
jgi:hypothetical protein